MGIRDEETKDGQCDMHLGALAAGLALSLVERRRDKKVINRWEPFMGLYIKLKKVIKYMFDKKNKRFVQYERVLKKLGQEVIRVLIPNKTRVAGALLIVQGSLRSMHSLRYYTLECSSFQKMFLNRDEWRQLAQFEAVMKPAMLLCFYAQGDRPEIAAEMVLVVIHLMMKYKYLDEYEVVDVTSSEHWTAMTPFHELPVIKMTTSPDKARLSKMP